MNRTALRRVWIVLRREYAQRIFSRSFIGTTLLLPGLFVAMFAMAMIMGPKMPVAAAASNGAARPGLLRASTAILGAGMVSIILFYNMILSVILWAAIVMRAVLEEKQSRVLEVLLCFA